MLADSYPNLYVRRKPACSAPTVITRPVSWMNSMLNGAPVVRRTGRLVEFNALWYNALMFAANGRGDENWPESRETWLAEAEKMKKPFVDTFP